MPWPPSRQLSEYAAKMEIFEAVGSLANTGAGARGEGRQFEILAHGWWQMIADHLGAARLVVIKRFNDANYRTWLRLECKGRAVIVPAVEPDRTLPISSQRWLEQKFRVDELVAQYPGIEEAVARYSPDSGVFAGSAYPKMFSGLTTDFDDTIVFEENGILRCKVLLEYKTAKRVEKSPTRLEGNAHERLSFQMLQYLEVATRYTRCAFWVLVNGAFSRLRNKYHVNFHIQGDRLRNFAWFDMTHASSAAEYLALYARIERFLIDGQDP